VRNARRVRLTRLLAGEYALPLLPDER